MRKTERATERDPSAKIYAESERTANCFCCAWTTWAGSLASRSWTWVAWALAP